MGRKQTVGKEKIKEAARELFFEKGITETSMRDVAEKAGCAVGLAYKYFENKEVLFSEVTDDYLSEKNAGIEKVLSEAKRFPFTSLKTFFDTLYRIFLSFKNEMTADTAKETGEKFISGARGFLVRLISELGKYGILPAYSEESACMMLLNGIGSYILSDDDTLYLKKRAEVLSYIDLAFKGKNGNEVVLLPEFAFPGDYGECEKYIEENSKEMSAFDKAGLWKRLYVALEAEEVLILRSGKEIFGLCVFSESASAIEYFKIKDAAKRKKEALMLLSSAFRGTDDGKVFLVNAAENVGEILGSLTDSGLVFDSDENGSFRIISGLPGAIINKLKEISE